MRRMSWERRVKLTMVTLNEVHEGGEALLCGFWNHPSTMANSMNGIRNQMIIDIQSVVLKAHI